MAVVLLGAPGMVSVVSPCLCVSYREKFIEYHDVRDAAKALEALNGHNFNGVTLQICFAQNASRTL